MTTRQLGCSMDRQRSLTRSRSRWGPGLDRIGPPRSRRGTALAVVLAGGRGERLHPLTARRCKPAVCFGGSLRIIDFTLFNCVSSGISSVHVLTQYKGESLRSYLNGRWKAAARASGVKLDVAQSRPWEPSGSYLGTADAVYKNRHLFEKERPDHVIVLSGDHVYRADYHRLIAAHVDRGSDVTLVAGEVPACDASSFGVLRTRPDGRVEEFVEKPANPWRYARRGECLINLGVYVFNTEFLLDALSRDAARGSHRDFGRDVLPHAVDRSRVVACPLRAITPGGAPYWRDVGTVDSLFQAHMDLLGSSAAFRLDDCRWPSSSTFHTWLPWRDISATGRTCTSRCRSLVSPTARINGATLNHCVVGSGAIIHPGAALEDCVVFPGARIGAGVRLRKVIVDEGALVEAPVEIGFGGENDHLASTPLGVAVLTA